MKRFTIYVFLAVIVLFCISACGQKTPTATVKAYYNAIEKNDAKALERNATSEVVAMWAMYSSKAQGMLLERGKPTGFSERITGNTAVVTVTFANGERETEHLVKDGGKWKVTMPPDGGK